MRETALYNAASPSKPEVQKTFHSLFLFWLTSPSRAVKLTPFFTQWQIAFFACGVF
jgi:hypothetical protein